MNGLMPWAFWWVRCEIFSIFSLIFGSYLEKLSPVVALPYTYLRRFIFQGGVFLPSSSFFHLFFYFPFVFLKVSSSSLMFPPTFLVLYGFLNFERLQDWSRSYHLPRFPSYSITLHLQSLYITFWIYPLIPELVKI